MNTTFFDSPIDDRARREQLYRGQVFIYSPSPSALALVALARDLIREAFGAHDPETAQYHVSVEDYAARLAALKPKFIHHPDAKKCIQGILTERGCDPDQTYFDVPRLRTATSDDYLTTGIAYAFHPHRDTWYSAPHSQLNWWMPVYDIEPGRAMAIHPRYWAQPVKNSSHTYNYAEWNQKNRFSAAQHIKSDTRVQPRALEELELDPQIRVVLPVGALLIFSAAHLHSTVPNDTGRTRFSIDFRTIHLGDVSAMHGAPNIDSQCSGTTMNDYLRVADLSHVPPDVVTRYDTPLR